MTRPSTALAAAFLVLGLAAAGCSTGTEDSDTTTLPAATPPAASPATTGQATTENPPDRETLQGLIPTPADTQQTHGPDDISDAGIHLHYQVSGAPTDVLDAYRAALEDQGWTVTTIIRSGGERGGGATYTGTHGQAYGVFDGGGYDQNTYLDVCAWPTKPAEPDCQRSDR